MNTQLTEAKHIAMLVRLAPWACRAVRERGESTGQDDVWLVALATPEGVLAWRFRVDDCDPSWFGSLPSTEDPDELAAMRAAVPNFYATSDRLLQAYDARIDAMKRHAGASAAAAAAARKA